MKLLEADKAWLDYVPDNVREKDNFSEWKHNLSPKDMEFFDRLLDNMIFSGKYVTYLGKTKHVYHNVYTTILNEPTWKGWQKKQWTTYIMHRFKSIDRFNEYVSKEKEITMFNTGGICFYNESHKFNLLVSFYNKLNPKVYALTNEGNKQVDYICSLHDHSAKKVIFTYIKLNLDLDCTRGVKSEQKIYDVFIDEVSRGYHRLNINPVLFSNNQEQYCFTYIPLNYNKIGETPTWDKFLSQVTADSKKKFMSWVYGIFNSEDYNRTVLWLEGSAQTGKTTVINAISDYLRQFKDSLVGTLAKVEDKFSLSSVINSRLVIYSDANDNDFFKRRDVLTLTGNDIVYYEEKFKNAESKRIFAKIFVTSNFPPQVNNENDFETSRLLHIKINKPNKSFKKKFNDSNIGVKMVKEMPFFLAKCKNFYE